MMRNRLSTFPLPGVATRRSARRPAAMLALAALIGLAACGDGTDATGGGGDTTVPPAEEQPTTPDTGGDTTIQ